MTEPVAIVTGASAGLGRALCFELAAGGYSVGLIARRPAPLRLIVDELKADGHRAEFAVADVSNRNAMHEAVSKIEAALGPVDMVIANAATGPHDQIEPFDGDVVETTFRVNVFGAINTISAVLPGMLERGRGHIVGISSLGADRGMPWTAAYTASKSALSTYLDGLRMMLKPRGIAVTTVCPGFIRTDMTADNEFWMPWVLDADEAARRIARALRRRPAVYRFPLGMSLTMRLLRVLPDGFLKRLIPDRRTP